MSRATVRGALQSLKEEGLIRREVRRGTLVSGTPKFTETLKMDGPPNELVATGLATSFRLVALEEVAVTPQQAELPGIELGAPASSGDGPSVAPELVFPSSVGEVVFPHKAHFNDMEIACESCHHETNARMLDIPHREYFADFWIDCTTCHHPSEQPQPAMSCSACHHCPVHCADETLSSKVVIHQSCWGCHEIGVGAEASASCVSCHCGDKRSWNLEEGRSWTGGGS